MSIYLILKDILNLFDSYSLLLGVICRLESIWVGSQGGLVHYWSCTISHYLFNSIVIFHFDKVIDFILETSVFDLLESLGWFLKLSELDLLKLFLFGRRSLDWVEIENVVKLLCEHLICFVFKIMFIYKVSLIDF